LHKSHETSLKISPQQNNENNYGIYIRRISYHEEEGEGKICCIMSIFIANAPIEEFLVRETLQ